MRKILSLRRLFGRVRANNDGQSLIEYLILVALMGVATLGVVRSLNHTVNAQFTDIVYALQGKGKRTQKKAPEERLYKERDMSDFLNGAAKRGDAER